MCALLGDMQRNGYCEYHGVSSLGTVNEFGYRSCKSSRKESAYAYDVHSQGFRINRPPASQRPGGALLSVRDTKSQIFHIKDRGIMYVEAAQHACTHVLLQHVAPTTTHARRMQKKRWMRRSVRCGTERLIMYKHT